MEWTLWSIVALGAVGGVAVFSFLYTLACRLWWEITLHELRVETRELRIEQEKRLAALRSGEAGELAEEIA